MSLLKVRCLVAHLSTWTGYIYQILSIYLASSALSRCSIRPSRIPPFFTHRFQACLFGICPTLPLGIGVPLLPSANIFDNSRHF